MRNLKYSLAFVLVATLVGANPGAAQSGTIRPNEVAAGSYSEAYLRTLQRLGLIPERNWSIRPFSPAEIAGWVASAPQHPWSAAGGVDSVATFGIVSPTIETIYNSGFPFGINDGPVWAGRGVTTSAQGGFWARFGNFSLVVNPVAFRAENADFELRDAFRRDTLSIYADPIYPIYIDLPQRYGDEPYTRLDPGESTFRFEGGGVTAGLSTASQFWGPAETHPMILGNNAGGFPHAFLGTSGPRGIWIGDLDAKLVWGRLDQSQYSSMPDSAAVRFATGITAVYSPSFLPGLEIGGARFFHNIWPNDGIRGGDLLQPFEGLLKSGLAIRDLQPDTTNEELRRWYPDNQLASLYARWVAPESGFEVYGEFAREDHNYDKRDLAIELTHNSGYMFGLQKAWKRSDETVVNFRAEVINTRPGISTFARTIPQYTFYLHGAAAQGHTQRGQILGSAVGYGGAGTIVAADYYHPGGKVTVEWRRDQISERDRNWTDPDEQNTRLIDLVHSLGVESVIFSSWVEITAGASFAYEFNRDYEDDATNLNARIRLSAPF